MKKRMKKNTLIPLMLTAALIASGGCSSEKAPAASAAAEVTQTDAAPEPSDRLTTAEGIAELSEELYNRYLDDIYDRRSELSSGKMTINGLTQRINFDKIGEPDENGYPLYILLRGGGNGDTASAKEQFGLMSHHYYSLSIENGICVTPLCIRASWDEHYRPESFEFYDRIIEDAVAFYNADPNRVYLLGFSSGGDGVYAISPRIPDRLAAVNMSAGYPHEMRLQNMCHLPICIQVGENDTAYNRHIMAERYDNKLTSAAKEFGADYIFETFIHRYGTHNQRWSDISRDFQEVYTGINVNWWQTRPEKAKTSYKSTCAVDWVNKYTRDPLPEALMWHTDVSASLRRSQAYYWLDRDGGLDHSIFKVSYSRENNSVTIEKADTTDGTLKIYLRPEMLDVFSDVKVITPDGGFTLRPVISEDIMRGTLYARGDRNYIFTSEIDVTFRDGKAVSAVSAEEFDGSYTPSAERPLYRFTDEGLLIADSSLFGISHKELCDKLGTQLPEPVPYKNSGYYDVTGSELVLPDGHILSFMFQDDRCMVICCDSESRRVPLGLSIDRTKYVGEFTNGTECRYNVFTYEDGEKNYVRQEYIWYRYQEWADMDASIALSL